MTTSKQTTDPERRAPDAPVRAPYRKPVLLRLGLLRRVTRFSF